MRLGAGETVFAAAQAALERWQQFRLGWLEAGPEETPIREGHVVAILARSLGLWWLNACRIVVVVNEDGPVKRFGFVYGTLPDHAGSGEERFLIEWDRSDDSVWYDILAFSRPRHFLARVRLPVGAVGSRSSCRSTGSWRPVSAALCEVRGRWTRKRSTAWAFSRATRRPGRSSWRLSGSRW
jgi:uncharacterized protein (UPF0548 family)